MASTYSGLNNKAMARKLVSGEALDVLALGAEVDVEGEGYAGLYKLRTFVDGKDYCDSLREAWIWSIGRSLATGEIFAATDTRYYGNPDFECLWLR